MHTETVPDGSPFEIALDESHPPRLVEARLRWVTPGGETREADSVVQDATARGTVCLVPEPMEVGQTVWLRWLMVDHRAVVRHCQRQGREYLVVLRLMMNERRSQDRLAAGGSGELHFAGEIAARAITVQVSNVSATGIQVMTAERLPANQRVRLTGSTWECHGQVRYCREQEDRFVAGIQFLQRPMTRGGPGGRK